MVFQGTQGSNGTSDRGRSWRLRLDGKPYREKVALRNFLLGAGTEIQLYNWYPDKITHVFRKKMVKLYRIIFI